MLQQAAQDVQHDHPASGRDSRRREDGRMNSGVFGSFGRRLMAFLIDVLPITAALFFLFYFTTSFGDTVDRYLDQPRVPDVRRRFLEERNRIRDLSGVIYLLYAAWLESSRWRGTVGKRLLGIRVVSLDGGRITFRRALGRNLSKMISIVPAFIGCLAMLWSKTRQAWHDRIAGTYVVRERFVAGQMTPEEDATA